MSYQQEMVGATFLARPVHMNSYLGTNLAVIRMSKQFFSSEIWRTHIYLSSQPVYKMTVIILFRSQLNFRFYNKQTALNDILIDLCSLLKYLNEGCNHMARKSHFGWPFNATFWIVFLALYGTNFIFPLCARVLLVFGC